MSVTTQRSGLGRVVLAAQAEAGRRGDRRVGTDHVLLALLADPDSGPAQAVGVSLATARAALQALDRSALAAVGITMPVLDPGSAPVAHGRLQLTPGAVAVFRGLGRTSRGERLGSQHVLLALLARERPDPSAELIDALGLDRDEVRQRVTAP